MDELKVFVNSFIGKVMTGLTITLIVFLCSTIYSSVKSVDKLSMKVEQLSTSTDKNFSSQNEVIKDMRKELSIIGKKVANLEGRISVQKNMSCEDIKKNNKPIEIKYINIDFEKELCLK